MNKRQTYRATLKMTATMVTTEDTLTAPQRREFWRWVEDWVRPYVAWALIVLGAVVIFLTWYGVSGESITAKQLPYLVSGGLTSLALFIVAAALLTTDGFRREVNRLQSIERKVDDLYALLVEPDPAPVAEQSGPVDDPPANTDGPVELTALPDGTSFHRADCALVAGKADASPVETNAVAARGLRPCPVCVPSAGGR
jgi:hypothetical protein